VNRCSVIVGNQDLDAVENIGMVPLSKDPIFQFDGYSLSSAGNKSNIIDEQYRKPVVFEMTFKVDDVKYYSINHLMNYNRCAALPRRRKKRLIGTRSLRRREQR
jgi:hypothetical protein